MAVEPPNGLDEIIDVFGSLDIPDFESRYIESFQLPYPLFFEGNKVTRSRCHYLMVDKFISVFTALKKAMLDGEVQNYGGIYNRRSIIGNQSHPSTHSWGIAIDLEPQLYPLQSDKRFSKEVVAVFADVGFIYGGDFKSRKDPMHFQFCTGY